MKTYIKSLIIVSLLFVSCYKDKGNYDYNPDKMSITNFNSNYTGLTTKEFVIKPTVFPENDNYEYTWGVYMQMSYIGPSKLDTIAVTKDLNWVCDIPAGTYMLVYTIHNTKTDVRKTEFATLSVRSVNSRGWYILKDKDGYTDFDMFHEDITIRDWIALNNNGKKLKGEAVSVAYSMAYQQTPGTWISVIMPVSTQDMSIFDISSGLVIRDIDNLFYEKPEILNFQNCCSSAQEFTIFNDGKISTVDLRNGKFGLPQIGDFDLSPQRAYANRGAFIVFDNKSKSFIYPNGANLVLFPDEQWGEPGPLSPTKMNADLLFTQKFSAKNYTTYALMKMIGKEQGMILSLALGAGPYVNPIMEVSTLPDENGNGKLIWKGSKWAANLENEIIYFEYDNKIYSFNIISHEERVELVLESGEKVTYMENIIRNESTGTEVLGVNNFVIATTKDGKYKVYRHTISAGRLSEKPIKPIFSGEGKVAKVLLNSEWGSNELL